MEKRGDMARAFLKLFPDAKIVTIPMLYEKEVKKYVMGIEEAHKMASKSKLKFSCNLI